SGRAASGRRSCGRLWPGSPSLLMLELRRDRLPDEARGGYTFRPDNGTRRQPRIQRYPVNSALKSWVDEVAALTKPSAVHWCDGSEAENARLIDEMLASGTLHRLNQQKHPNCYLHRSDPSDVARTEHLTFICSKQKGDTGPTNNWMEPGDAK